MSGLEIGLAAAAGILTGLLSAIFGVGGGQIVIPFMVLVLGVSQHLAEGTSLLVIIPTAMAGAWAHSRRGYVSWRAAALLTLGGVVGAVAGALVAVRTDALLLRRLYAIFVLFVAYRFLKPRRQRPIAAEAEPPD